MILSSAPVHALAWAAVATYALSAFGRPVWGARAQVLALVLHGLSLAAALSDRSIEGPIVCVVSGGNIDLAKFCELVS